MSEPRYGEALRKMDGDILVTANRGENRYTFASQTLNGACKMASAMRDQGWKVDIRAWDGSVYQTVHG